MLESTNQYLAASREYMGKAYHYLSEEDFPQASEKAWGAAAEMVKAIAEEERGRYHRSSPSAVPNRRRFDRRNGRHRT